MIGQDFRSRDRIGITLVITDFFSCGSVVPEQRCSWVFQSQLRPSHMKVASLRHVSDTVAVVAKAFWAHDIQIFDVILTAEQSSERHLQPCSLTRLTDPSRAELDRAEPAAVNTCPPAGRQYMEHFHHTAESERRLHAK